MSEASLSKFIEVPAGCNIYYGSNSNALYLKRATHSPSNSTCASMVRLIHILHHKSILYILVYITGM